MGADIEYMLAKEKKTRKFSSLHVTKLEIFLKTTKLVSASKIALLKALSVLQLSIGSA